jgi:hypothetical protein
MIYWRQCPDQPEYEVSSSGEIKRSAPNKQGRGVGRIIKQEVGNSGYLELALGPKVARKRYLVHRLVLRAFVGEPPTPEHWVAHNDGRRLNNSIENLRWATPKENQSDKRLHGTHLEGEKVPWSKVTGSQVTDIRSRWANGGISQSSLGLEYGIGQGQVWRIIHRKQWASHGT